MLSVVDLTYIGGLNLLVSIVLHVAKISEEKINKIMVKELKDREELKAKSFTRRRRRFHEEKDIDSINDRSSFEQKD